MVFSSSARTINHIFYRINLLNKSSPLNWVSKYQLERKMDIAKSVCEAHYSRNANYDLESNEPNFLYRCRLNLRDFCTNYTLIVSYTRDFQPIKLFSSVTLITLASSHRKNYREPMKWCAWLAPDRVLFITIMCYYVLAITITIFSWGITWKWRKQTADPAPAPEKP